MGFLTIKGWEKPRLLLMPHGPPAAFHSLFTILELPEVTKYMIEFMLALRNGERHMSSI